MATSLDRDLAIRAVLAEAGNQGPVGQAAVAHVIRNRMAAGRYGGSDARGVVLAKNQFEPFNHFGTGHENDPARFHPSDPAYQEAGKIVDAVMTGQLRDPTGGATHFYAPVAQAQLAKSDGRALTPAWAKGPHVQIGGHMFFNPDDPNGLDLSQSFGRGGQKPGGSFDMASNAGGQSAGAGGPGASAWPTQPSMGSAPAQGGGGSALDNYFRSLQQNAGQQQQQHGVLNQLLFGQQGWQQHMPQGGLLSALFQKFGQGGAQPPAGAPTQLPGAAMAGGSPSTPGAAPTAPNPMQNTAPAPAPTPSAAPANAMAGGGGFLAQLLQSLAAGGGGGAA